MASTPTSSSSVKEGKVALITGGAGGIGAATARLFCQQGAKVVIADIQDELGLSLCNELGGPSAAAFVHCDVTKEDEVRDAVDAAVSVFGKLDVMFCNAGKFDARKPIADADAAVFDEIVAINLRGAFLGAKHAARVMVPARRGSIIFTASVAGVIGAQPPYAYTASKHAIVGLMKNAAVELGKYGVRANCVSPYGVATRLLTAVLGVDDEQVERMVGEAANLKGPVLKAEDIAMAVLYLANDEAGYVSGHNLVVDGGYSIVNPLLSAFP